MRARQIRLLLEYDGTRYAGWQVQRDRPSIQATLATALGKIIGAPPPLRVAGRTDAGVHALGQVASFRTTHPLAAGRFAAALNFHLPADISVHESAEVPDAFDPRHSAQSKRYRYRVYHGPQPAALERRFAWHLQTPLDLEAMRAARQPLLGEHDFEAFRSAQCDAPHAVREIFAIDVSVRPRPPSGEHVEIVFHADAFCRHMCRILAGTLIEVGRGKRSVESVAEALAARDRRRAGLTAPAQGLTLLEVIY